MYTYTQVTVFVWIQKKKQLKLPVFMYIAYKTSKYYTKRVNQIREVSFNVKCTNFDRPLKIDGPDVHVLFVPRLIQPYRQRLSSVVGYLPSMVCNGQVGMWRPILWTSK